MCWRQRIRETRRGRRRPWREVTAAATSSASADAVGRAGEHHIRAEPPSIRAEPPCALVPKVIELQRRLDLRAA
jgi:hypothetical protein